MAKKVIKRTVRAKAASGKRNITPTPVSARSVALAGVAAGVSAIERARGGAMKVYATIAKQAEALRNMTAEAAESLSAKTGMFVNEGKKMQSRAAAAAQTRAAETSKEVQLFANKSRKAFAKNMSKTIDATVENAKEGITRLEHVFETRVARTLNTFGVPSAHNVRELQSRMAELQKALNQLNRRGVRA